MKRIYLDNAATTALDPVVLEAMMPLLTEQFGNPSSIHGHGRTVRSAVEKARKKVAELLGTSPAEILFTSGGTEADNTAITNAVYAYGIQHVITSKIEHHAVLHTVQHLEKQGVIQLHFVNLDENGHVDTVHLETLLKQGKCLVSLMHGNNEVGNLIDLQEISELCGRYDALFHSDTVQTMGHYKHEIQNLKNVNFLVGAAHKFHGPKGVGFLYVKAGTRIPPMIHGGAQERNMRGGTENVYGIVGMAKALEIAYEGMETHRSHVENLKSLMISQLRDKIEDVRFNGASADLQRSLYTVLNVCFPPQVDGEMLLFNLDIVGISASGGSACSSGTNIGSHVLNALGSDPTRPSARFSFSKNTTTEDITRTVEVLAGLVPAVSMV